MENEPKQPFYLGIIGPRVFSTGGYDPDDPLRCSLRNQIDAVINDLQKTHPFIIGLTGLHNGPEKDFFYICQNRKIECHVILPFQKLEEQYKKLPTHLFPWQADMMAEVLSVKYVSDGVYSPRKMLRKNIRIIQESNAVIMIHSIMTNYSLLEKALKKKQTYNIYAN